MTTLSSLRRILVIRRDNIGDLLCTTPLLSALRQAAPGASIEVLCNSYNAPVLAGNPDVDRVYSYTKAKHADVSKVIAWWREWRVFMALRRRGYDLVIHANPLPHARTEKLIRLIAPQHALAVVDAAGPGGSRGIDIAVDVRSIPAGHHVQRVFSLLRPLGIDGQPGPMHMVVPEGQGTVPDQARPRIGLHVSSRVPCNRWPEEYWRELIGRLAARGWTMRLFWAPGRADNARHPGDDELAGRLAAVAPGHLEMFPTANLDDLARGLSAVRLMIAGDGGAMHMAVALGKPTVALFGCTDAVQWGPWGVPSRVCDGGGAAGNVPPETVFEAMEALAASQGITPEAGLEFKVGPAE
ncbi:MAG: glycosyltransferase family 9 protein [Zoogloeaceae bacterium]|nr:glycosyltransferase family 9 protein [Gammaproteobacteria bacterium]MCP5230841.1 glycosyltransferase family 9 protein [Zoogloeaceae bacterium]